MTYSFLATHGSFGLNFNPFETNIINLAIVIAGLIYFLRVFLVGILERRKASIVADLKDAEEKLANASAALSTAQKQVADSQALADKIRSDAKARAEAVRLEIERRTVEEMARMKTESSSDLANEAARVSTQLRREAARLAIEKALADLPTKLDDAAQSRLIDQSLQSLGPA